MQTASRPPLRRLAALDKMIRSGEYPNASSAARQLDVHARTVHRDLEFLRDSLRAPLAFDHAHNGYCYTDPDYALPLMRLTEAELVALFLAERLLHEYRGTPYAADLAAVFAKLTAALRSPLSPPGRGAGGEGRGAPLDNEVTIDLSHLAEAFSFHQQAPAAGDIDLFRRLSRAVHEGRQLELLYWSASTDETCTRVVDPYHLASLDSSWYLIGYCHLREAVRMFTPSRIRRLQETGVRCERPADFRIADYLDAGFRAMRGDGPPHTVRLRFTPKAARWVRERTWHPSQQLEEQEDGGLVLTLKVTHLLEVKRWVLSWGTGCRVLEPEELRQEVVASLRTMLQAYETNPFSRSSKRSTGAAPDET